MNSCARHAGRVFPPDGIRLARLVGLLAPVLLPGCFLQILDMDRHETPVAPIVCGANQRIDPSTGRCADCVVRTPAASQTCLCQVSYHASPFPYCEGDEVDYDCLPCTGDVSACAAYDSATGVVRNCHSLQDCCHALATDSNSTPCCTSGTFPYCKPSAGSGQLEKYCCACPACNPTTEFCCIDCGCTCEQQAP